jgi:hypothetical protein
MILGASVAVFSHCDTLNGPVIADARKALDTGNVNLVLIWVQQKMKWKFVRLFRRHFRCGR